VGICEQPPEVCVGCVLPQQRRAATLLCEKPCVVKAMSDGWQPRWPGDMGDPFEPYTVRARNCTGIHLLISGFNATCIRISRAVHHNSLAATLAGKLYLLAG